MKSHDKHHGKSHKDRNQHKHHGKKKFHEVTKVSDSDMGLSSSSSDSDAYEDGNIDELTVVTYPINVDTLHRGSEVYVDLETVKTHVPFSAKVDTGARQTSCPTKCTPSCSPGAEYIHL